MNFQWILSPLTQCAIFAAGLGLAVYLFVTLKIEMRAAGRRGRPTDESAEQIRHLQARIEAMAANQRVSEEWNTALAAAPAPGTAFQLNRRSQALRQFRRGDSPAKIASSLGMTGGEVELLLKVHKIVAAQARQAAAPLKRDASFADLTPKDRQSPWGAARSPNED